MVQETKWGKGKFAKSKQTSGHSRTMSYPTQGLLKSHANILQLQPYRISDSSGQRQGCFILDTRKHCFFL